MTSPPPVLLRAQDLVVPALREAVGTLSAHLRTPAQYHFGWVDPDGTPRRGRAGKAMRPALVVLGAEAAGADAAVAVPAAVALELIHNFSLIHDDIVDGDRTRHHRPTVWDVYGVGDAVLVGDALHTLAFQVLIDDPNPRALAALRRLAEATAAMLTGQAEDTALDRRRDATLAECVEMEHHKTAALLGGSVAVGAILGGADAGLTAALERYGFELGLAFQAVDDVLGIWGDAAITGKPVGNDLREHKKSLPVVLAFEGGGALAAELRAAFGGPLASDAVGDLATRMAAAGIRDEVTARARAHRRAALDAVTAQPIPAPVAAELEALARFVVEREF